MTAAPTNWQPRGVERDEGGRIARFQCEGCDDWMVLSVPEGESPEGLMRRAGPRLMCRCRRAEWPHPNWRGFQINQSVAPIEFLNAPTPPGKIRRVTSIDRTTNQFTLSGLTGTQDMAHWTTEYR